METIFAPITATINSPIIVIRISGTKAKICLDHLGIKKNLVNRQATLCNIIDIKNEEIIDQSLITFFNNPNSFTGEDVVEIAIHGSIYIIQKITDLLLELKNVRLAEPGEFSKRAFMNNRIDLVQAEAIVDLIESQTKIQHQQALKQFRGDLGRIYNNWRSELISIAANLEAFIDFPDEDLPTKIIDDLEFRVFNLIKEIKEHLNDSGVGEKIRKGLSLTIIGAPNAGKSSLINYLAKSDVAIVSKIAGTTRDIINVHLNICGVAVIISDTAGIRKTNNSIEKEGVSRALKKAQEADLKILIIDAGNPKIDQYLIDKNTLIIVNKIDLNGDLELKINHIAISIKNKINLKQLLKKLEERVKNLVTYSDNSPPITRARYRYSLNNAIENLSQFSLNKNIEFAAEDLRLAIREIGKITGKIEVDDILGVIFSSFCVGK
jgi:tRNA modification GTPase